MRSFIDTIIDTHWACSGGRQRQVELRWRHGGWRHGGEPTGRLPMRQTFDRALAPSENRTWWNRAIRRQYLDP
jgi:hypothetical protein